MASASASLAGATLSPRLSDASANRFIGKRRQGIRKETSPARRSTRLQHGRTFQELLLARDSNRLNAQPQFSTITQPSGQKRKRSPEIGTSNQQLIFNVNLPYSLLVRVYCLFSYCHYVTFISQAFCPSDILLLLAHFIHSTLCISSKCYLSGTREHIYRGAWGFSS
ncbi:hypothetical protein BDY21DRAFT_38425 [Lineolata rhizophorae]|uniref:Uncharacterized protein n=1 Tax=Lineolata rhizophorae TaxID=578093 RepID=A0A6A6NZW9_9PEZI|nr:hypothetical protein BDY21DRAFT_38425 [Lineolata rhizophorae]